MAQLMVTGYAHDEPRFPHKAHTETCEAMLQTKSHDRDQEQAYESSFFFLSLSFFLVLL